MVASAKNAPRRRRMPRPNSSASALTATPAASGRHQMPMPVVHRVDADVAAEPEEDDVAEVDVAGIADHQVQIAGENDVDGGEQQALAQLDVIGEIGDARRYSSCARSRSARETGGATRVVTPARTRRCRAETRSGTRTNRANSRIGIQLTGMNGVARPSMSPSATPPSRAPAGLPSPPSTVTTKLLSW